MESFNLDKQRVPRHIAIIMDGNGRWATQKGKDRSCGHQAGAGPVGVSALLPRCKPHLCQMESNGIVEWTRME